MKEMGIRLASFAITFAAFVSVADGATRTALSAFHTPNWTIQCVVVGEETPPALSCWNRQGRAVSMKATGTVGVTKILGAARHDPFAARRLLGAKRYWRFGTGFGCFNRGDALRCWNHSGHGWWWFFRSGNYRLA